MSDEDVPSELLGDVPRRDVERMPARSGMEKRRAKNALPRVVLVFSFDRVRGGSPKILLWGSVSLSAVSAERPAGQHATDPQEALLGPASQAALVYWTLASPKALAKPFALEPDVAQSWGARL